MKNELESLQRACLELHRGLEEAAKLNDDEQLKEALGSASAALIEMRRATDNMIMHIRTRASLPRRRI